MNIRTLMITMATFFLLAGFACAELKDNGDGTLTDTAQGLVWLKNAGCFSELNWSDAKIKARGLKPGDCGLAANAKTAGWRLPTKDELAFRMSNKTGFTQIRPDYWSSTDTTDTSKAWIVTSKGASFSRNKASDSYVWPVRFK